jgi:hypothetical protein
MRDSAISPALGYCRRLGFAPNDILVESTLRTALDHTANSSILQCEDSLLLGLMAYGIIPTTSTFPGDPPERGVSIAVDSQLVAARSRMLCYTRIRAASPRVPGAPAPLALMTTKAAPVTPLPVPAIAVSPPHVTPRLLVFTTPASISPVTPRPLQRGQTSLRLQVQSLQYRGRPALRTLAHLWLLRLRQS